MTINRKFFFDHVRHALYKGSLHQEQIDGIDQMLDYWEKDGTKDDRWLAYILGTAYHETVRTFGPIEEIGRGKNHKYGREDPDTHKVYYGRGLVQLTWRDNYRALGKACNIPNLEFEPELALKLENAIPIIFVGMEQGLFEAKHHYKLANFFHGPMEDWTNARRIVNGLDRADDIRDYSKAFYAAISYTV